MASHLTTVDELLKRAKLRRSFVGIVALKARLIMYVLFQNQCSLLLIVAYNKLSQINQKKAFLPCSHMVYGTIVIMINHHTLIAWKKQMSWIDWDTF